MAAPKWYVHLLALSRQISAGAEKVPLEPFFPETFAREGRAKTYFSKRLRCRKTADKGSDRLWVAIRP